MDWEECKIKRLVKEVKSEEPIIESLKIQSDKKFQTAGRGLL